MHGPMQGPPRGPHFLLRWMLMAFTMVASHAGRALMRFTYAASDGHFSRSTCAAPHLSASYELALNFCRDEMLASRVPQL